MKAHRSIQLLLILSFGLQVGAASRILAQPGYMAKGVPAHQSDGTLLLDTTPCAGAAYKRYILFRPNYRVVKSTAVACSGSPRLYDQLVVYQDKVR